MTELGNPVRLLDVDPDLGGGLTAERFEAATEASSVGTWVLGPGGWSGDKHHSEHVALYVIGGALARRVSFEDRSSLELIGPGQLLRPALSEYESAVHASSSWEVLTSTWFAVLDRRFWASIGRYPEVLLALLDRAVSRSRALGLRLAIVGHRRLTQSVLALLWHLAEIHGRVGPAGVTLALNLSHERVAALVSAQRSSVSAAIKQLAREGRLSQPARGTFLLHGAYERRLRSGALGSGEPIARPAQPDLVGLSIADEL